MHPENYTMDKKARVSYYFGMHMTKKDGSF